MARRGREVVARLRKHVLTPAEARERRYGVIPDLALRPDLSLEVRAVNALVVAGALRALHSGEVRNVLIADEENGSDGVLVPVERYVGLIAIELATGDFRVLKSGRLEPALLADGEVKQSEPTAGWGRRSR